MIPDISATFDAVETAILSSFEAACTVAALAYANAPLGDDTAPDSCDTIIAELVTISI